MDELTVDPQDELSNAWIEGMNREDPKPWEGRSFFLGSNHEPKDPDKSLQVFTLIHGQ